MFFIPWMDFILDVNSFWLVIYFWLMAVIFKSGSMAWYKSATTFVKPFIADNTITKAAVVTAIAIILIQEIMLMALFDFLEIRYLLAMKKERFKIINLPVKLKTFKF